MKQHLDGQKHKAKLPEIRGEMEKKRWNCEVCNTYCTREDLFKLHLRGKKHMTKRAKDADVALEELKYKEHDK